MNNKLEDQAKNLIAAHDKQASELRKQAIKGNITQIEYLTKRADLMIELRNKLGELLLAHMSQR